MGPPILLSTGAVCGFDGLLDKGIADATAITYFVGNERQDKREPEVGSMRVLPLQGREA